MVIQLSQVFYLNASVLTTIRPYTHFPFLGHPFLYPTISLTSSPTTCLLECLLWSLCSSFKCWLRAFEIAAFLPGTIPHPFPSTWLDQVSSQMSSFQSPSLITIYKTVHTNHNYHHFNFFLIFFLYLALSDILY